MQLTEDDMALDGFSVHLNFAGLYYVREPDNHDVPLAAFCLFRTRDAAIDYCRRKITGEID